MAIPAGTKLGTYEVTSHIGSGGMGEVYQAHDSKLGRDVAIKVLPEQFARDPERLARFQREAKMLAALNHPNIAAIYGLEQSGSTHYLVMELVPGKTLAERHSGWSHSAGRSSDRSRGRWPMRSSTRTTRTSFTAI